MTAKIIHPIRDPRTGLVHKAGEQVNVIRKQIEVGTHRTILFAQWVTGTRVVLLPDDVTEED